MIPSSRTPEGTPNHCDVCGHDLRIEPSRDTLDGVCPNCWSLLWFSETESLRAALAKIETADQMKIRNKVLLRAIEKFGPIPLGIDTTPFLVDLPEADGWRWYLALDTAQTWDGFSRL